MTSRSLTSIVSMTFAFASLAFVNSAKAQLRISQIGKGAVSNFSAYDGQFIEIFNAGSNPVVLTGKSLQWSSTAGGSGWTKFNLEGTIAPQGYWLVRLTATNTFSLSNTYGIPFFADQASIGFNGTFPSLVAIGNSAGKVALVDSTALLTSAGCVAPEASFILDLVSWDDVPSTAACHEGSACALIPFPGNFAEGIGSTAVLRRCGGLFDTNDNFNDFVSTARSPRNSFFSGAINGPAVSAMTQVVGQAGRGVYTGYAGQTALFTAGTSTCTGTVTSVTINLSAVGGSAAQPLLDNGTQGDVAAGDGIYSYAYTIPAQNAAPLGKYTLSLAATDSSGRAGTSLTVLTIAPAPPANDHCAAAQEIPATVLPVSVSATGNLVSATPISLIATSCTGNTGNGGTSRDVWYTFTPLETANYTITTCNPVTAPTNFTALSTNLSVFASCPADDATDLQGLSLACTNSGCSNFIGGSPSTIFLFPMNAGTTYYIRVAIPASGTSVAGGPFRLDITSEPFGACCFSNGTCVTMTQANCAAAQGSFNGDGTTCTTVTCPAPPIPGNDDCLNATVLADSIPVAGTTYGATGTDVTRCNQTSWDLWYSFTASASGPYRMTATRTSGSETPSLGVFSSCPPVTDADLACNTASGVPVNSLDFQGVSGTTYLLRVAAHFSQRTDFNFVVKTLCYADLDNDGNLSNGGDPDGGVDINDLLFFLSAFEAGLPAVDLDDDGDPAVSQPDGGVDINDLLFFLVRFERGC